MVKNTGVRWEVCRMSGNLAHMRLWEAPRSRNIYRPGGPCRAGSLGIVSRLRQTMIRGALIDYESR
jgi:hypothetical protein